MYSFQAVVVVAITSGLLPAAAAAAGPMPSAQQNALVEKYCAVCHTDAARNGGLSLQHFDAAQAPPSLNAMLLSKLTGGVVLKTVGEAHSNPDAAAFIDQRAKTGAMAAAGIPIPGKATVDELIYALAAESAGASEWRIERSKDAAPVVTASTLQEATVNRPPGEAESYRLIASCNTANGDGYVQLAWSPVAQNGSFALFVDGDAPVRYHVEGSESMGNNSGLVLHALASRMLTETRNGIAKPAMTFPAESLIVSGLFPNETVTFSFTNLPADARQQLQACFRAH